MGEYLVTHEITRNIFIFAAYLTIIWHTKLYIHSVSKKLAQFRCVIVH